MDYFTPYRAVSAEGARIGLVTCRICGATVTLDPDDPIGADQQHMEYHRERGELKEVPVTREDFLPDGEPAEKDEPF